MSLRNRRFLRLLLTFGLAAAVGVGCLGNDFSNAPLSINERDHGWVAAVEPGEVLEVDLTGNAVYPEEPWRLADFDPAVIALDSEHHETPRPPSGDPDGMDPEDYDPGSLISFSFFGFVGVSSGETPLRFEIVADGELIDIAEYTIAVVEDACEADTAAVANRCGGDGFQYHPQTEWEADHGRDLVLEPGGEIEVTLTANALYPDASWQVVESDPAVAAIESQALGAAREPGDFSDVDPDHSHSFLPAWIFTVRGVALGESPLVMEITVDGKRVDVYERTVLVVEDAEGLEER
jgi:hypothetical protein